MIKQKFLDYYMKMAEITADLSSAVRLKVGTVIVRDNQVLATGYNGTPSGWDNECEDRVWDSGAGGWLDPEEFDEKYPMKSVVIPPGYALIFAGTRYKLLYSYVTND